MHPHITLSEDGAWLCLPAACVRVDDIVSVRLYASQIIIAMRQDPTHIVVDTPSSTAAIDACGRIRNLITPTTASASTLPSAARPLLPAIINA